MQIFYTSVEGQRATFQVRGTKFTPRKGIELLRKKKKIPWCKVECENKKEEIGTTPYFKKRKIAYIEKDEVRLPSFTLFRNRRFMLDEMT